MVEPDGGFRIGAVRTEAFAQGGEPVFGNHLHGRLELIVSNFIILISMSGGLPDGRTATQPMAGFDALFG